MGKLRVGLIQDPTPTASQIGLRAAFERRFELTHTGDRSPAAARDLTEHHPLDAIVWHVDDAWLATVDRLDWGRFAGRRVQFEEDALQDFSTIAGRRRRPPLAKRNFEVGGFDTLVVTGRQVAERLADDGLPAAWIPKGYDAASVRDEHSADRSGVCTYGTSYPARRAALRACDAAGLRVERFACEPDELGATLNRYAAGLVCNMELVGAGVLPGRVLRRLPRQLQIPRVGMEPMIKNFEIAGAGCAPVCDAIPELHDLGFVDGESMVAYRSFGELVEKLRWYERRPDELRAIGTAAAEVAAAHTWDDRAARFEQLLRAPARTHPALS